MSQRIPWPHGTEKGADQEDPVGVEGSHSRNFKGLFHSHQPEAETQGPHAMPASNTGQILFFVYGKFYMGS